jgi:hypothetical protein
MNKLTNNNQLRAPAVAPAGKARSDVARRQAPRSSPIKSVVRPIRIVGKTAIFALEVAEVIGFGLALL